jgi:hypothetical protein
MSWGGAPGMLNPPILVLGSMVEDVRQELPVAEEEAEMSAEVVGLPRKLWRCDRWTSLK